MWLRQVAFFVQVHHDVADRGGAQAIPAPAGDRARRYRFSGGDIGLDDLVQNFEAPWRHSLLRIKRLLIISIIAWNFSRGELKLSTYATDDCPISMSGFLKTWQWAWTRAPQRESWGLDRNWHRSEAARHVKSGNFADAERHLALAVREADDRGIAAGQRVELRLELASLQSQLAAPEGVADGTAQ